MRKAKERKGIEAQKVKPQLHPGDEEQEGEPIRFIHPAHKGFSNNFLKELVDCFAV